MGEFADMDLDRMLDEGGWFKATRMAKPNLPRCNRCGKRNLDWHHTGVRWRLMEQDGKLHDCLSKPASPDEFEVLP